MTIEPTLRSSVTICSLIAFAFAKAFSAEVKGWNPLSFTVRKKRCGSNTACCTSSRELPTSSASTTSMRAYPDADSYRTKKACRQPQEHDVECKVLETCLSVLGGYGPSVKQIPDHKFGSSTFSFSLETHHVVAVKLDLFIQVHRPRLDRRYQYSCAITSRTVHVPPWRTLGSVSTVVLSLFCRNLISIVGGSHYPDEYVKGLFRQGSGQVPARLFGCDSVQCVGDKK